MPSYSVILLVVRVLTGIVSNKTEAFVSKCAPHLFHHRFEIRRHRRLSEFLKILASS